MSERTQRIHELIRAAQEREGRQDVGLHARLLEYEREKNA